MSATTSTLRLVSASGLIVDGAHWATAASVAEQALLADLAGPVLDIGCGPGRHVVALAEAGIPAMGIDVTPTVLEMARARGAPVLSRSVFDRVPGAGRWASALLLDGNLGIGADPVTLLRRTAALLRNDGMVLVEAGPPGVDPEPHLVRLECDDAGGPAFPWADVDVDEVPRLAAEAGLCEGTTVVRGRRHFVHLTKGSA